MSKVTLLERAKQLDRDAFSEIFDTYYDAIYRYIYHDVRHKETAEDLAQEVFHRLVDAMADGKGPERHLKAWLYKVARNLVIDEARKQSIRQHDPLDEVLLQSGDDVSQQAQQALLTANVREAMDILTPKQKDVIVFKFLQGLTTDEIARIMAMSRRGVLKLQQRGLAALRTHLVHVNALREEEPV